ncbi:hypothetical protein HW132_03820 [Brasilonema sp. CT11]|nr:hypothetical protein [Brasilonema sp. CT11]
MSYFIIISGKSVSALSVDEGFLTPIKRAQSYISSLASDISSLDGSPAYLWEDGKSGTSTEIVYNLENHVREEKSLNASVFGKVISDCESLRLSLRLWWANNNPHAFTDVACVKTMAEVYSIISQQACNCDVITLLFKPNN